MIDKIAWIHLVDGRVLSTRSAGKDVWYLPGGKREPGESDLDTLVREIDEELSVRIDRDTAAHLGTFQTQAHGHAAGIDVRMACYTAGHTGEFVAANEIAEFGWLTMADLDRIAPVDKLVFAHLAEAGLLVGTAGFEPATSRL